jgi:hypothetical protein
MSLLLATRRSLLAQAVFQTPLELFGADLLVWCDAETSIFSDAGTTPAADTDTIQQWNDLSGNDFHLTQATGAARPVYDTTGFNSRPSVVFVTGDYLVGGTDEIVFDGNEASIFMVVQITTGATDDARLIGFATGTNDFDNAGKLAIGFDSGIPEVYAYRNGFFGETGAISYDTPYRIGIIADGTNETGYVNNVAAGGDAINSAFAASLTMRVGATFNAVALPDFDGLFSEIVVVKRAADLTERNALDAYFKNKWGLS